MWFVVSLSPAAPVTAAFHNGQKMAVSRKTRRLLKDDNWSGSVPFNTESDRQYSLNSVETFRFRAAGNSSAISVWLKTPFAAALHSFKAIFLITEMVLFSFGVLTSICPPGYKIKTLTLVLLCSTVSTMSSMFKRPSSQSLYSSADETFAESWSSSELQLKRDFFVIDFCRLEPSLGQSWSPSLLGAEVCSVFFFTFLGAGLRSGEETDVGRQRLNRE